MKIIKSERLAVSPVIATLLLVAIAVVGSTITVAFAQNAINIWQISGYPAVELVTITGYDARDELQIMAHNGLLSKPSKLIIHKEDGVKTRAEGTTVFIKNDSVKPIVIKEVRLAGTVYSFSNPSSLIPFGSYAIVSMNLSIGTVLSPSPEIEAGQEVTLVFSHNEGIKVGRTLQFKLTTANGFIVIKNIKTGDQNV